MTKKCILFLQQVTNLLEVRNGRLISKAFSAFSLTALRNKLGKNVKGFSV